MPEEEFIPEDGGMTESADTLSDGLQIDTSTEEISPLPIREVEAEIGSISNSTISVWESFHTDAPTSTLSYNYQPLFGRGDSTKTEEGSYSKSLKNDKNPKTVPHYKTKKNIKFKDAIFVYHLHGYFHINDPEVVKDVYSEHLYIHIGKEYREKYGRIQQIFTEINEDGVLSKPVYSLSNEVDFNNVSLQLSVDDYNNPIYVPVDFLTNTTFRKHYKELIHDGSFIPVKFYKYIHSVKSNSTQYRKTTKIKRKYDINKPTTFINTFGKKYSFGYEIETASGYLPPYLDSSIDYSAVHDGSLRDENGNAVGGEYVTGVLKGDKGLYHLKLLTNELSKRCTINKLCGNHVHIGDASFSKEDIVLMYYLYSSLETEIFSMLPLSRRNNEYCRPLTPIKIDLAVLQQNREFAIDKAYNEIIKVLAQVSRYTTNINKKNDHPKGFKCGYDHSAHRYCWVNFIPAVFNTRGNRVQTIEFRNHSATTSYIKCKNWLMICMALVDIVENHKDQIYKNPGIRLVDIIKIVYPKNHIKLLDYIYKRMAKFSNDDGNAERSDYVDNEIDDRILLKNL